MSEKLVTQFPGRKVDDRMQGNLKPAKAPKEILSCVNFRFL